MSKTVKLLPHLHSQSHKGATWAWDQPPQITIRHMVKIHSNCTITHTRKNENSLKLGRKEVRSQFSSSIEDKSAFFIIESKQLLFM